ncbi:MAG: hypothetical protein WBC19_15450 [Pyrinomonadaceae bacterium]
MKNKLSLNFVLLSVISAAVAISAACGGAAGNTSNAGNAKNSNSANTNANSNSNANTVAVSDKPPIVTTADNLQLSSDWIDASEFPGRTITVSGYINHATKDTLSVGYSYGPTVSGNGIDCKGDFSQYTGIEEKVNSLAKDNKAPKATVKGTFKSREDKTITLEPCVLVDIAK